MKPFEAIYNERVYEKNAVVCKEGQITSKISQIFPHPVMVIEVFPMEGKVWAAFIHKDKSLCCAPIDHFTNCIL